MGPRASPVTSKARYTLNHSRNSVVGRNLDHCILVIAKIVAIMSTMRPRVMLQTSRWACTLTVRATFVQQINRRCFTTTEEVSPVRPESKLFKNADAAVADVRSGSTILSSGFGLCGVAGEFTYSRASALNIQLTES